MGPAAGQPAFRKNRCLARSQVISGCNNRRVACISLKQPARLPPQAELISATRGTYSRQISLSFLKRSRFFSFVGGGVSNTTGSKEERKLSDEGFRVDVAVARLLCTADKCESKTQPSSGWGLVPGGNTAEGQSALLVSPAAHTTLRLGCSSAATLFGSLTWPSALRHSCQHCIE